MKCQRPSCEQEATIHFTEIVNGTKKEMHLCEACSKLQSDDEKNPFGLTDFFLGDSKETQDKPKGIECPDCHWTYEDFRSQGKLGCPKCYGIFQADLQPLLKRLHHDIEHHGKVPRSAQNQDDNRERLETLRKNLQEAVSVQDFEKAAALRDEIRNLESAL